MLDQPPPPLSRKVRRVVVRGAAVAGIPAREVVEELGVVDGDVVRVEEERAAFCVSCQRLASATPIAAICCVCSGSICSGCVAFCSECEKACCSNDRTRISSPARVDGKDEAPKYRCAPCDMRHSLEVLLAVGLVVAAAVAAVHFGHW